MRSKWLESASSSGHLHDDVQSVHCQPSTSGRHQRWFNVMQGIRRSLDVHLKSYYKIDSAFASALRLSSSSDKLKALTRALTDTGLVDFSCVYLVHPARGTFGVIALSGAGAELYPPLLGDEEALRALGGTDSDSRLNVFTRCVFQVKDSNWCVEDVVASRAPWYYDCASAINGFGLPQDGGWLRRAGMRSVLALPCMQGNDVTGVLTVASKQKSLDHLLLRKLEELCYKVTPIVSETVVEFSPVLCNRRMASRYESISDFAHEVLGELLNLDRAVAVSVGGLNRSAASVGQPQQQGRQQQQSAPAAVAGGSSKGRKLEGRPVFDASTAVAAAAAAGFSWTTPPTTSSAPAAAARPQDCVITHQQQQQQQQQPSDSQSVRVLDTYCTAMTDVASYSVMLTADLPSVQLQADVRSAAISSSERPTTGAASLPPLLPLVPVSESDSISTSPQVHLQQQQQSGRLLSTLQGCDRAPYIGTTQSLPERCTADVADAAFDLLRFPGSPAASTRPSQVAHHYHYQHDHLLGPQQQSAAAAPAPPGVMSGDRNPTRSTRSLSCLEFSGGISDAREELGSVSENVSAETQAAAQARAVAARAAAAAVLAPAAAAAEASSRTPAVDSVLCHTCASQLCGGGRHAYMGYGAELSGNGSGTASNRTSASGNGYMIESRSTEELVGVLRHADGGGRLLTSPSAWSSKTMESRVIVRGVPLEPSVGAVGGGRNTPACAAAAASPTQTPAPAIVGLSAARGSSCATSYSTAVAETATTCGYACSSCQTASAALYGSGAVRLSGGWVGGAGGAGGVRDLGEVRTSLHGMARSRWSRDSAAAAAAIWSNEAAEAFAAAMHFTAAHPNSANVRPPCCSGGGGDDAIESPAFWKASAATPIEAAAAATTAPPHQRTQRHCTGAAAFGGLYGIRESEPFSSLQLSLELSDSEDGGVTLVDLSSGSGGAVVLSSGLGVEALRRQQHKLPSCSGGGGSRSSRRVSQSDGSVVLASSYDKVNLVAAVAERFAVHA